MKTQLYVPFKMDRGIYVAGSKGRNSNTVFDTRGVFVYFLVKGYWGCAAGWGCIFTTGLTIMGLHF